MHAFLGHAFHPGNGALGILLVVKGNDLDVIGGVADLDAAQLTAAAKAVDFRK